MLALVPAFPLLGAIVNTLLNRRANRVVAGSIATLAVLASAAVSFTVLMQLHSGAEPIQQTLWTWMSAGRLHVDVGFRADALSATMMCIITGIGTLIHAYSIGYMDDEADTKS